MKSKNITIFEANAELKLIEKKKLLDLLATENLLKMGYSIDDIVE
jgi:hypothetical protein